MQWNCASIFQHGNEFNKYLSSLQHTPEIICLQETKLKTEKNFSINGYIVIRKDRNLNKGEKASGGVAILVKETLQYKNMELKFDNSMIECLGITLIIKNSKVNIINVYDPPTNKFNGNIYKKFFQCQGNTIITGDFNAHNCLWKSNQTDKEVNVLKLY